MLHPGVEHDPANWDRASYSAHPADETEPQESAPNDYRQSAIACLQLLSTIDSFVYEAKDPRVAWLGIGLVLNLNRVRGLTTDEVVRQIRVGCLINAFTADAVNAPTRFEFGSGRRAPSRIAHDRFARRRLTAGRAALQPQRLDEHRRISSRRLRPRMMPGLPSDIGSLDCKFAVG